MCNYPQDLTSVTWKRNSSRWTALILRNQFNGWKQGVIKISDACVQPSSARRFNFSIKHVCDQLFLLIRRLCYMEKHITWEDGVSSKKRIESFEFEQVLLSLDNKSPNIMFYRFANSYLMLTKSVLAVVLCFVNVSTTFKYSVPLILLDWLLFFNKIVIFNLKSLRTATWRLTFTKTL